MSTVTVQLLLKDRLLQEVPFTTDALSIGRMKENDLVINNLSVSRFHAVLRRDGEVFVLEDKGSENGTFVNGERAEDAVAVVPGDEIRVGKHKLVLRRGEVAPGAESPERGASDVWDSAQTYFAGPETLARLDDAPRESGFLSTGEVVSSLADRDEVLSSTDSGAPTGTADDSMPPAGEPEALAEIEELPLEALVDVDEGMGELSTDLVEDEVVEASFDEDPLFADSFSETADGDPLAPLAAAPPEAGDPPGGMPDQAGLEAPELDAAVDDGLGVPDDSLGLSSGESDDSLGLSVDESGDSLGLSDEAAGDPLGLPVESGADPLGFPEDASFPSLEPAADPLLVDDVPAGAPLSGSPAPAEESATPDQTAYFAFGSDPDGIPSPELDPVPTTEASGPELRQHAGLIVQRAGQLERVLAWEQEEMHAGRAAECEVFLGSAEISRRHASFVRDGDRYEVRDLDSINGIEVNGERVRFAVLQVGDVIRIEDYELTFVLDAQPVAAEVQTAAPSDTDRSGVDAHDMTQLHAAITANPALGLAPAAAPEPEEADLLADLEHEAPGPDEDKPLEMDVVAELPDTALDLPAPEAAIPGDLSLRIVVRREELPEPLRRALVELGPGELRIPVELCISGEGS